MEFTQTEVQLADFQFPRYSFSPLLKTSIAFALFFRFRNLSPVTTIFHISYLFCKHISLLFQYPWMNPIQPCGFEYSQLIYVPAQETELLLQLVEVHRLSN